MEGYVEGERVSSLKTLSKDFLKQKWTIIKGGSHKQEDTETLKWPTNKNGVSNEPGQLYSLIRVLEHGNVHFRRITWSRTLSKGMAMKREKPWTKYTETQSWQANIMEAKTRKKTLSVTLTDGLPRNCNKEGLCNWQGCKPVGPECWASSGTVQKGTGEEQRGGRQKWV